MALFLSSTRDEFVGNTRKFSLFPQDHLETYRIWMFALLRDRPTRSESTHMNVCEQCGSVFNASLGVTTLREPEKDTVPSTGGVSRKGNDSSRAA
ncbi:MAG TPA: hypothetical protein VFR18_15960 [Terriglobia bacterium]|nr:hypothetical protein [Terriglobia bacterium]